jgi:hypothetical protein
MEHETIGRSEERIVIRDELNETAWRNYCHAVSWRNYWLLFDYINEHDPWLLARFLEWRKEAKNDDV